MADLYRKSSLEKISSPEQLDKALTITSPLSWLALLGITLIIAITVVWAIWGSLPTTISCDGILVSPINANALFADDSGKVTQIFVNKGSKIEAGDKLVVIENALGISKINVSTHSGTISEIFVEKGDFVLPGNEIFRLTPHVDNDLIVLSYIPLENAHNLEPGMKVIVNLAYTNRQKNKDLEGEIINIDSYAASVSNMVYVLGSDNMLVNRFAEQGAVVAVTSKFKIDASDDKKPALLQGAFVDMKIITEEAAPISKLFFSSERD